LSVILFLCHTVQLMIWVMVVDVNIGLIFKCTTTFCGFVLGCEALALSGRAACTKPLLYVGTVNLAGT